MEPLVSVITPCYNGERYLNDYFESLLAQTYSNIEIIFINDGSFDSTEEIATSYRDAFTKRGIRFIYLKQENFGQAAAINAGLPYITGKYFVWPDSDDILDSKSIEKRVLFLEQNPECGLVRSLGCFISENTKKRKRSVQFSYYSDPSKSDIYLDLINETTFCTSGCYMVRTDLFMSIYPDKQIYQSRAGQNWQILIPMAGRYKCGFIDEELYYVRVHSDSHSRSMTSFKDKEEWLTGLREVLKIGIEKAERTDLDYQRIADLRFLHVFFDFYMTAGNKQQAKEYYRLLKKEGELKESEQRNYLKKWYPICFLSYRGKSFIKHKMITRRF